MVRYLSDGNTETSTFGPESGASNAWSAAGFSGAFIGAPFGACATTRDGSALSRQTAIHLAAEALMPWRMLMFLPPSRLFRNLENLGKRFIEAIFALLDGMFGLALAFLLRH